MKKTSIGCPVCNAKSVEQQWDAQQKLGYGKMISWCADCGFGWQNPLPTPKEINDYYDNYTVYNIHGENEKEESSLKRINRINKLMPNRGRLLDIGSGLGYFLKIAQENGWNVAGIEPQKSAALYCQNQLKIKVYTENIESIRFKHKSFDVITLWDVFEHIHEPMEFLNRCLNLLASGGLLVIAVPNASGLPARIFKGKWRYIMGTHLNYYTVPYIQRIITDRCMYIERIDHTIKVQSLLQGFTSLLPFQVNTERIIRLGRRNSIESGRPEQATTQSPWERLPLMAKLLGSVRKYVLKINLTTLPGQYGDLMDLYCRKNFQGLKKTIIK